MEIVTEVHNMTESFPTKETYGYVRPLRRSAVSTPSNIAMGAARLTRKEFIQWFYIPQGSLSELDAQFELSKRMEYLNENIWKCVDANMDRVDKLLSGLIRQQQSSHTSRLTSSNPGGTHVC